MIGSVTCPAFNYERVYFNKYGFDHLIWKGKKMRSMDQQRKRICLSKKAPDILRKSEKYETYRILERASNSKAMISMAHFWSFIQKDNAVTVIVIVRQTNNGSKHFFSVMDR